MYKKPLDFKLSKDIIINSLLTQMFYSIVIDSLYFYKIIALNESKDGFTFIMLNGLCMFVHLVVIFAYAIIKVLERKYNDVLNFIIAFLLVLLVGFASCSILLF